MVAMDKDSQQGSNLSGQNKMLPSSMWSKEEHEAEVTNLLQRLGLMDMAQNDFRF